MAPPRFAAPPAVVRRTLDLERYLDLIAEARGLGTRVAVLARPRALDEALGDLVTEAPVAGAQP